MKAKLLCGILVLLGATAVTTSGSSGSALSAASTERVSLDSSGGQANGAGDLPSTSADGRFVAFQSPASNLVPGDSNGTFDAFVRDRQTGATERVSVDSSGAQGSLGGGAPSISADGRFVAFTSRSAFVLDDTNGVSDIYVRDRVAGTTERVSVDSSGAQGAGFSRSPAVSADGRFVAFESASALVPDDTNGVVDVYVHDRQTGTTERDSISTSGAQGDRLSDSVAIGSDGRFVAFQSEATNLVPGDTDSTQDIFVRDRTSGTTELISQNPLGQAVGGLLTPAISGDGRFVAFTSNSPDLVPGDTNSAQDVFVRDRQAGVTARVSVSSDGTQADSPGASLPGISTDGQYVAFHSAASNLVPDDTNGAVDVFIRDRVAGITERASVASDGQQGNGPSLQNSFRGPAVSSDGRFVAFGSQASNLVTGDTNGVGDVFVRDRGAAPPPPPSPGPVLMIHGIDATAPYGNDCAVTWDDAKAYLRSHGFADRELLTIAYYDRDANCDRSIDAHVSPSIGNSYFDGQGAHTSNNGHTAEAAIEHLGYHLAWFIYDEYSSKNMTVDILAHSMGGLIARYALAEVAMANPAFPPHLFVTNVVNFGTPHGGARIAGTGLCKLSDLGLRECSEMQAGSALLTDLEQNGWNPQGDGGTDWTAMGSDDDNWVAADRAVGTSRDRQTNLYFGACHKVWYPAFRIEGKKKVKQSIEHSDYLHDGTIVGGMNATNLATYSSADHCGAPLDSATGQRHPMGQAALALSSSAY